MSFEAMKSISEAETEARGAKVEAQQNAKKALDEAGRAAKARMDEAVVLADSEIKELMRAAEQKAQTKAIELSQSTANRRAAMRAQAESRLDQAAAFIVERIVNS
jgi:vacuolar-type H+-ATPase subunit H